MDEIIKTVTAFIAENTKNTIAKEDYTLLFKTVGGEKDGLGIIIDAIGKTQTIADTVCSLARSRMLHCDYEGRHTTAGNLAFPFSPSDIHVGAVYEFSVFHLAKVDDLSETCRFTVEEI